MEPPPEPSSNPAPASNRTASAILRRLALAGVLVGIAIAVDLLLISLIGVELLFDSWAGSFAGTTLIKIELALVYAFAGWFVLRWCWGATARSRIWTGIGVAASFAGLLLFIAYRSDPFDDGGTLLRIAIFSTLAFAIGVLKTRRSRGAKIWSALVLVAMALIGLYLWFPLGGPLDLQRPQGIWGSILLLVLPLAFLVFAAYRMGPIAWKWIGVGYLALLPIGIYLATDDPVIRYPVSLEEISPAFPGAEASHAVLLRYSTPEMRKQFRDPGKRFIPAGPGIGYAPSEPAKFRIWLTAARAEIQSDWAAIAPVRAWWSELAEFDRIADLHKGIHSPLPSYQAIRTYEQLACSMAAIHAMEGNGDAAFALLQPVAEVARKLEPTSRTLVRGMMSRVAQRDLIDTANFVLDSTPVSTAARARLAAALTAGSGGPEGARRLVLIEYAAGAELITTLPDGNSEVVEVIASSRRMSDIVRHGLMFGYRMLLNPRRTLNLYGELTMELQEMAGRRQFDRISPRTEEYLRNEARPRFKNLLGSILLSNAVPSYSKVIESYWKIEDLRLALIERLAKP